MLIKFTELIKRLTDYQDIFHALKNAVVSEYTAFLQYNAGAGTCHCDKVKASFIEKANDEFKHVQVFYKIIQELGGTYIFQPQDLLFNTDCSPFTLPFGDAIRKIEDNIKGENCAITSYSTLLQKFDFSKEHTKAIQSVIDEEKVHVSELVKLLKFKKKEEKNIEPEPEPEPKA